MKRILLSLVLALGVTGVVQADIQSPPGAQYTATRKLGRAISNIIYSPIEIPSQITLKGQQYGDHAALSWGLVEGTWRMLSRMGYGMYELVTFWAPTYKCTYKPPYQGNCGQSGLIEFNPEGGLSEFPPELGFQSYYDYSRDQDI